MDERLVVNASRFAHETIDDETVLINSETGHVLLLTGLGSILWSHLVGGTRLEALAGAVDARFGTEAGAAARDFISELRAAEIVVPTTDTRRDNAAPLPWPERFIAPIFERYDDIAKIIAMDPIHDVDDTGWPRPAKNRDA